MKTFKQYFIEAINGPKIIMIGGPGSGKSTYSNLIKKELGIAHIYTGDMMRELARQNTPEGRKVKELLSKGEFAPTPIVIDAVKDRMKKPETLLTTKKIKQDMGWCDDIMYPKKYNRLIKINNKIKHEKLRRNDNKYDLLIPISYNRKNPKVGLGSCIFIHLTKDYKPTAGCIALKKKDFLILLKLIKKNSKIKIS